MSRILFAAKQSWMTLRMSRPLFVSSYLQVTWWALGQWKGKKIAPNDDANYQLLYHINPMNSPLKGMAVTMYLFFAWLDLKLSPAYLEAISSSVHLFSSFVIWYLSWCNNLVPSYKESSRSLISLRGKKAERVLVIYNHKDTVGRFH